MNNGPRDEVPESLEDPFAELDEDDSTPPPEDPFEKIEVEAIDEDEVWNAILEDDLSTEQRSVPDPESGDDSDETVVKTEQYCKNCEHFSAPPDSVCTNPGTEIVELVGVDQFLVRNCPVVESRKRAETVLPDDK
jgi:hypothetical protein